MESGVEGAVKARLSCRTPRLCSAWSRRVTTVFLRVALLVAWANAGSVYAACEGDSARHIRVGVSDSARPYVFPSRNSGIEIDIVRRALAHSNYVLCPLYQPNLRSSRLFRQGAIDALLNVMTPMHGGYLSAPVITFQNCVYSLPQAADGTGAGTVSTFRDLIGLRVAGFQGAYQRLQKEFRAIVPQLAYYTEVADQELQLKLLLRKRVDAVVMDQRVFRYYMLELLDHHEQHLAELASQLQLTQEACLFEPSRYRIEFANESVRDVFDKGLQQLRTSGEYQRILDSYSEAGLQGVTH